jgi:hypothetical protein
MMGGEYTIFAGFEECINFLPISISPRMRFLLSVDPYVFHVRMDPTTILEKSIVLMLKYIL